MFLTTQSHDFGRSCLWVDVLRSSTAVLLELKDIYYFSRSVLNVTEPWAINPSRNTTSCSDWLIVTIVPNVLKSFSALHSKCFHRWKLSLPERSTTGNKIVLEILKEVAFVGCKFQAKFCAFVGLFDSTIQLRKSFHVAVRLGSQIDQNRQQITSKCGTNMGHDPQASV